MHAPQKKLFDGQLVHDALVAIRAPDQVVEARVLNAISGAGGWPATWSGYFDDAAALVSSLGSLRAATGIYITVNPVNAALLARANNRLRKAGKGETTADTDVVRRRWLLVDADAMRPAGISASDEEHALAIDRAREIQCHLQQANWPGPLVADSGNGGHLMYRVDLPSDDEGLTKSCLEALANRFSDERVKIDTTVFNPARIWKLYGTLACKGDDTTERPHRFAKLLSVPAGVEIVPTPLLEQLAGEAASADTNDRPQFVDRTPFDLEVFIREHQLDVDGPHDWSGKQGSGRRWTLKQSPLCDHHDGAAFILQHGTGAITAQCHHNSCKWNWHDLRRRFEKVGSTKSQSVKRPSTRTSKPSQIEPYRPFPVESLPQAIGYFVTEAAAAIGCDTAYVVLPTLACLARAIGNSRVVRLKSTWSEPAIVWAAIVGKSGTHKSPALKAATQILERRQAAAIEKFQEDMKQYEREKAEYEKEFATWKRSKGNAQPPWEPEEPHCQRYIVSDITVEAMADRMAGQQDGLLVVRDELAGWVNGIGEYKGGAKSSDTGHWLATWSGAPMTVDRKTGARKTIHIPRAAVSLVGGIQPGILRSAIGREHMQDGLCARLLLAMPSPRVVRWSEAVIRPETEEVLVKTFDRLLALESAADSDGRPEPYPLNLTPEAKQQWVDYYNRHRDEQVGLDDDLAAAWSKLEAYTARFSLIFQLCSWAAGDAEDSAIDEVSMRSAIAISDWFGGEARRVYSVLAETEEGRELRELVQLIERKGRSVTPRDLMRSSRRFPTADDALAALDGLAKAGLGSWEPVPPGDQGGRPTHVFQLVDTVDVDTTP